MIHYYRYLFVKMKVFNYSELHFSEVTFYRIHTLGVKYKTMDTSEKEVSTAAKSLDSFTLSIKSSPVAMNGELNVGI